jgi:hypothetical protein
LDTLPTPQDGETLHNRFIATLEPAQDENQLESLSEDEDNSTQNLETDPLGDDTEEAEESTEEESQEAASDEETPESSHDENTQDEGAQYNLSDIAALSGVDESQLDVADDGSLLVKTKIDGIESATNLKDLVVSYQKIGHLDNQTQKTAEAEKAFEAKKSELDSQVQAKLQQLDDLSSIAYNSLMAEYNEVNWNELQQEDPTEYLIKQRAFEQRNQAIQGAYQQVQAERQNMSTESAEKMQAVYADENSKLAGKISGWDKPEVAQKEFGEVISYGEKLGYPSQALSSIQNHLDVVVLHKAMMYDKMQEQKSAATKKVRKAPKLAKPGSPATRGEKQAKSKQKSRETLRKHGDQKGVFANFLLDNNMV